MLFGSKSLNYKVGDGSLPKMKPSRYFPHHLPGQPTLSEMDFGLLSEEAKSGKYDDLLDKVISFAQSLEYLEADFNYSTIESPKSLASAENTEIGDTADQAMAFLANSVKRHIDNQAKIYFELMPYLEKFEEKLGISLSIEQRKLFMFFFRVGMGLSLIENLSGINMQGYSHPSISNVLHTPRQVLENIKKHEVDWNLDFLGDNSSQMARVKSALYVGYFQSKYTAESPDSVMEFVIPVK